MRAFAYDRPSSEVAAIRAASMLAQLPEIKGCAPVEYLAGGTTLVDLMKLDVMRPETLVDIGDLGRRGPAVERRADALYLNAATRMSEADRKSVV